MYSIDLNQFYRIATFQFGWNSTVVVASTTILGLASGLIGTFIVLQKRSLVADAVSHCTLLGVSLAFLFSKLFLGLEKQLSVLLIGAGFSCIIGLIFLYSITSFTRLKPDVATALTLSLFFGLGILVLSLIQTMGLGGEGGLHHFIFGQTASMKLSDAYMISGVASFVFLVLLLLQKELFLVGFDREFAYVKGFSPTILDVISLFLLIIVVLVGMQAVGMLLIVAFIVMPSVSARFWTNDSALVLKLSGIIGAGSGFLGSVLSGSMTNVPAGALIVLVSGLIFIFSFMLAPNRGLVSSLYRLLKVRIRIEEDHVLRESIINQVDKGEGKYVTLRSPYFVRLSYFRKSFLVSMLAFRRFIILKNSSIYLSPSGLRHARTLDRNSRLWKKYLDTYSADTLINIDYSTDLIEHVLSKDIVDLLNSQLDDARRVD